MEVQWLEGDARAKFWRRVDLDSTYETVVVVPLRFMRGDGERSPRWDRIRHLAICFRTSGTFRLDSFGFRSQPGATAELSPEELASIAFPRCTVRSVRKSEMVIMTDRAEPDLSELEQQLNKSVQQARRDMPFLGQPSAVPVLLGVCWQGRLRAIPIPFWQIAERNRRSAHCGRLHFAVHLHVVLAAANGQSAPRVSARVCALLV